MPPRTILQTVSGLRGSCPFAVQRLGLIRRLSSTARSYDVFKKALSSNQQWAATTAKRDPQFFPKCAQGQAPPILWLGCADSRIPETTILGLQPGDVFTHRNIANIINATDLSMLSIVQYAVAHMKVQHVVLCGHTSCGGVAASLANAKLDVLDVWLQPLRALRERHAEDLVDLSDGEKATFLAKANIRAGVETLQRISTVIDAVRERDLQVHGVLYHLGSGLLEEVDVAEDEAASTRRITAFERK